jgi:hypothetical protein
MRNAEIAIAALFMGISGVGIWDALRLGIGAVGISGPQAGFIIFGLSMIQLAMAGVIMYQGIRRKKKAAEGFFINREAAIETGYVVLVTFLFCLLMGLLGTYVAIFVFSIVFTWWLGKCRWYSIIGLAVIMTFAFYFGFEQGLMIPLPKSPWYPGLPF